jgi:hypothetical protein
MRSAIRTVLALVAVLLLGLVGVPPAAAQDEGGDSGAVTDEEVDNLVVLTGRAVVSEGDTVDAVVIADGPAVIDGTVRDGIVALNGDVVVRGTAREDVVALDGRVTISGTGRVEGDVVSRHRPVTQSGGQLDGSWERFNPGALRGAGIVGWLALWVAVSVSTLVLGLLLLWLAPRVADAAAAAAGDAIGPVIGWGLLLTIGLPIVAVLAMVTLVGFPLGLGLLLALGLIYGIGYTTGAWLLGRRVARRAHPMVAFLAGWAILRVLALVPVLGAIAWFVATVVGLGALAVAGHRSRRRVVEAPVAARAMAGPPPTPATP